MDNLLDRFYEDLDYEVKMRFTDNYVKVSQLKSSFFVLVKQPRGKILGDKRDFLFATIKRISEELYYEYCKLSCVFEKGFFPYFKLVKSYEGFHFHFLVVKKDYG